MARVIDAARGLVEQLVKLIADDPVIVGGALLALTMAWLVGRDTALPHVAGGIVLFAAVWATLGASLWRFVRRQP